jgi:hypothetical protein
MAMMDCANARGLRGLAAEAAWRSLSGIERAEWIDRTFEAVQANAAAYDEANPIDPSRPDGGGQSKRPDEQLHLAGTA